MILGSPDIIKGPCSLIDFIPEDLTLPATIPENIFRKLSKFVKAYFIYFSHSPERRIAKIVNYSYL